VLLYGVTKEKDNIKETKYGDDKKGGKNKSAAAANYGDEKKTN
jgi:hypothetical protein